jgi:hypothetical protein
MEYRWYIGKEATGSNLINLSQALWDEVLIGDGGTFAWGADQLTHNPGITYFCDSVESKADVFLPGRDYKIIYDFEAINTSAAKPYVGNFTCKKYEALGETGDRFISSHVSYARSGGVNPRKMKIVCFQNCILRDLEVYLYDWLPVLTGADCPVMQDKLKINYKLSDRVLGCFIKAIEDVVFYGASYDRLLYLYGNGYNDVPVKIQARFSPFDDWFDVFLGRIYLAELQWDSEKRIASGSVEDDSESALILKNLNKQLTISVNDCRIYQPGTGNFGQAIYEGVEVHNPSTGVYGDAVEDLIVSRVTTLLNNIILLF